MNAKRAKHRFNARATVCSGLTWLSAALLLIGAGPMFAALVVSNRAIDDGPDPGDLKLIADWDAWAFSPWLIACTVLGLIAFLIRLGQYLANTFQPSHRREPA
jgi:hypothetical protein